MLRILMSIRKIDHIIIYLNNCIRKIFDQPVSRVMPLEIFNEHLVHTIWSRRVAAGISHGAPTSIEILPHYHRNFPQSWIGSRGTGWYHAVVEELVIQCVRPTGRSILINWHGRIVCKVCVPQHLEHIVSSDLRHKTVLHSHSLFS